MQELSAEYVAGFVDGEGAIRVRRGSRVSKGWNSSYELTVEICNTYKPILDDIAATYGGSVAPKKVRNPLRHKPQWYWTVAGTAAYSFLEQIRPHLREKSQQAWLGMEFWAQTNRGGEFRRVGVPADQLALREGFYLAMRGLHGMTSTQRLVSR